MYALHVNMKPVLVAAVLLRPLLTRCGHITISFLLSSFLVVGDDGLGDNGMVGNNGEGVSMAGKSETMWSVIFTDNDC
jgi:hypothetical protein